MLDCYFLYAAAVDCASTHFFIHCGLIVLNLLHCELFPLGLSNHVLKYLLDRCPVSGSVWMVAMLCGYGVLHTCPVSGKHCTLWCCANCVCSLVPDYWLRTCHTSHPALVTPGRLSVAMILAVLCTCMASSGIILAPFQCTPDQLWTALRTNLPQTAWV